MLRQSGQKSKKKHGGRKGSSKPKPVMVERYIDENGNVIERLVSDENESLSPREEYYVAKADKTIAEFDRAWAQASGSTSKQG
ncbi:hypothetical protein PG994_004420 [Apiospora phragmitis]|uniref:Uncharacterized protein n=1 Tax=Apiospora phragmitis TaxID=2905665 RepID=A0ABR1VT77_9PEZI